MVTRLIQYQYQPHNTYVRNYVNHFFRMNAEYIFGSVLDLGANKHNESQFRELSSSITDYYSADISYSEDLNIVCDARCLPFKKDSFDTVILSEVLEHIPIQHVESVLTEIKRILKPSGRLLASTPFVLPIHSEPNDFYRATYYGLESLLDEVGMEHQITIGGGYSQVLLHHLHRPLVILSDMIGSAALLYLFSIVHYSIVFLGFIIGKLAHIFINEGAFYRRYITQFVVATPD